MINTMRYLDASDWLGWITLVEKPVDISFVQVYAPIIEGEE